MIFVLFIEYRCRTTFLCLVWIIPIGSNRVLGWREPKLASRPHIRSIPRIQRLFQLFNAIFFICWGHKDNYTTIADIG